ncbi:MAG: hypothetical protein SVN78_09485, partial [Deferribacterota bacterium]|nr:hypothetical protein [Deferribacterota bacterium]
KNRQAFLDFYMDNNFRENDFVVLIDNKGKRKLLKLAKNRCYFTHKGRIEHNNIIGKPKGSLVYSDKNVSYCVFGVTYNDYVLGLKRKAQIIYPKDIAILLQWGDVYSGLNILEAGLGMGALSIALLRALADRGRLVTYEIREDFIDEGKKNIINFFGEEKAIHEVVHGDIYQGFTCIYDRVFLDVPEPWHVLPYLEKGLVEGGIVMAYIPTILQVKSYVDRLNELECFRDLDIFENIRRPWQVEDLSVRPKTWIYNHSAFIVFARKIS